jgi:hypothetical protein
VIPQHWPQPKGQLGLGASLGDFVSLTQSDPNFATAWGDINAQLDIEGASVTEINSAKVAMTNAFEQISTQAFGLSGQDAINAAKQFVLTGQTVIGAVNTIRGLISAVNTDTPVELMQAFTGTMVAIAVGAGAFSMGLGAAIVAAVGAVLDVMQSIGLFGRPPSGVTISGCGGDVHFDPAPDYTVGCIGLRGPRVSPTSLNWRTFPTLAGLNDSAWFEFLQARDTHQADLWGTWKGVEIWAPHPNSRLIDFAFPKYARVLAESNMGQGTGGYFGEFLQAFYVAWRSNAEYGLNGLQPQPDEQVLIHTLRLWNRAHLGPLVSLAQSATYPTELVPLALNTLSSADPLIINGSLGLASGSLRQPPVKLSLHMRTAAPAFSAAASTETKVIAGTAAVGGAALLGTAIYSAVTGIAIGAVVQHAWKHMKGWFRT